MYQCFFITIIYFFYIRTKFYNNLKNSLIFEDDCADYYAEQNYKYNEDIDFFKEQSDRSNKNEIEFSKYNKYLNYINIRRKGIKNKQFEKTQYIFITNESNTRRIAHDYARKNNDHQLAVNLFYCIDMFWYKLNKGLGKNEYPKSMEYVIKAKFIISKHIKDKVSEEFERIKSDKEMSREANITAITDLRELITNPDDINSNNIDNIFKDISEFDIENNVNEKEFLKKENKELNSKKNELEAENNNLLINNMEYSKEISKLKDTTTTQCEEIKDLKQYKDKYMEYENKENLKKDKNNKRIFYALCVLILLLLVIIFLYFYFGANYKSLIFGFISFLGLGGIVWIYKKTKKHLKNLSNLIMNKIYKNNSAP